jgi:hypothetical protein
MLNFYRQQVQRLIGDPKQERFNLFDLDVYINLARQQVAAEGECIRFLTPISSGVSAVVPADQILIDNVTGKPITDIYGDPIIATQSVVGSGYTDFPSALFTLPDLPGRRPTVETVLTNQQVTGYTVIDPGEGYMFPPQITIEQLSFGASGSGAQGRAILEYTSQVVENQEKINFIDIPIQTLLPGAAAILSVRSIAVIWSNVRYVGNYLSFSKFQALVRSYTNGNFLYTPFWWSQFGQGAAGSVYMYPNPDQTYPVELDCLCLPLDLATDTDIELIPAPWTAAVPFYAAFLAMMSMADPAVLNLAATYYNERTGGLYSNMMRRARAYSMPSKVSSWYGRSLN